MGILPQLLSLLKPLTVLIGPAPLFYLYRGRRFIPTSFQQHGRPLPRQTFFAILLLGITAFVYLSIYLLGAENIFYVTRAPFVTSSSVLGTRLIKLRPLTEDDRVLLERLGTSLSERLNY